MAQPPQLLAVTVVIELFPCRDKHHQKINHIKPRQTLLNSLSQAFSDGVLRSGRDHVTSFWCSLQAHEQYRTCLSTGLVYLLVPYRISDVPSDP